MMQTPTTYDYAREAAVLVRYLQPGQPPLGDRFRWEQPASDAVVYLGEVDVSLNDAISIADLTPDPVLQGLLRENALGEGSYDEDEDRIDFELDELTVDASCRFSLLSPFQQARYRLVALLVNSQGVLEGDGHTWALETMRDLAEQYWERPFAKREGWRDESWHNTGKHPVFDLLVALRIDLEPWCVACGVDRSAEIPPTPPLSWVKETRLAQTLFQISEQDLAQDDGEEIDAALAYALHALKESQPNANWETALYLADVVICDLPTFEETRDRLAERIASVPSLHEYAARARGAADMEQMNALLRELYDAAETQRIWVIA